MDNNTATGAMTPIVILGDNETWMAEGAVAFLDDAGLEDADACGSLPDNMIVRPIKFHWSDADDAGAAEEGWKLHNDSTGLLTIERTDCTTHACASDMEAVAFVYWKAASGSDLHMRAMTKTLFQPNRMVLVDGKYEIATL